MNDNRDCENCRNHSENGCSVWNCEFEPRMIGAYDDWGNVVDLVEWEERIRADERAKVLEELNKLKEEIKKLEYYDFEFNCALLAEEVYDIIDKRISELKGGAE